MKKKLIAFSMIATLLLGSVPVYAANSTGEDGSVQSQVIAQVASSWVVTVPATINIGAEQSAYYSVTVRGDVANDTSISVIPDANITLTDGESTSSASITQEKQQWLGSEVTSDGVTASGNITLDETLTAGTWAGQLNFTVNCTENLGDLLDKIALMNQVDLYVMGDSVMDGTIGTAGQYYGTAEAIDNLYGTNTYKSYAVAGAYITNDNLYMASVQQQAKALKIRVGDSRLYNEHTVIVFDGGGNDIKHILEDADAEIDNEDIGDAFGAVMSTINSLFDEFDVDYTTPVVYVIPKTKQLDDEFDFIEDGVKYMQQRYPNLILVDCREFLTEADLGDYVHPNKAGQTKMAHAIVDAIYEFYNNQQ